MQIATSAGARRRARLRTAVAAAAFVALFVSPTATSGGSASPGDGQLRVSSVTFGGTALTEVFLVSSDNIAKVRVFAPQGYELELGRPAGASIGLVTAFVGDPAGGFGDFATGELVVDDPARYASDASAQACAPGPHAAAWRASLDAGARTLELAVFLDPSGTGDPAGSAYVLSLCPVWPSSAVGVAHQIADGFAFLVEQGLRPPTASGRFTWSALVTPAGPSSLGAEPSRTFEVRSIVPLPRVLTLRAKHEVKSKSVVVSGRLVTLGQPEGGVPISFGSYTTASDDFSSFGPVTTNAAGEFSIRRPVVETTVYSASVASEPVACTSPSAAPRGCASETVAPPPPAQAAVIVRKRTDPRLAVRPRDRALARAASLKLTDFPPGWEVFPFLTPLELCPTFAPNLSALTATGEARSPGFLAETAAALSRTTVYATESQARTAFGKQAVRAVIDCVADQASGEDVDVLSVGRLSFPRLGQQTRAFRFVGADSQGVTYLDLVSFRRGRVVVHMLFGALGGPLTDERSLAAKVAARARPG